MKLIIVFVLIQSFIAHAWEEEARALLPEKLKQLSVNKTTLIEATKVLGKADLIEEEKYYWKDQDFKYAIELTFKDSKLASLHYNFPTRPSWSLLNLKDQELKEAKPLGKILKLTSSATEVSFSPYQEVIQSVRIR